MTSKQTWTFEDWQRLTKRDPAEAAGELHRLARERLSETQRRAVLAWLPTEVALTESFAAALPSAPLFGVPYFLKDLFDLRGIPTWAGSTFLPEVRPTPIRDSTLVQALKRTGAVCAGKTHLNEFAYGITGENPHYGDCEHPRFPGRVTGGSSSGSAAAVAAGLVPLAFGTDTGGSIRVPAAFCGLYGFRMKPEHPWIEDAFPLAPGCDTAGWFTANPADLRTANAALVGLGSIERPLRGNYLEYGDLDAEVALACRQAADRLCAPADATLRTDLVHGFSSARETYSFIVATQAWNVHQTWAERFHGRYDPAVWSRLNRVHTLTKRQLDSALVGLAEIRALFSSYFTGYDFLVMPATPCAALTKADCTLASRNRLLTLTSPASLAGLPVLTIPVALPSGLTTGLQVIVNDVQSPAIDWALQP